VDELPMTPERVVNLIATAGRRTDPAADDE
jgi:hypothetical protein